MITRKDVEHAAKLSQLKFGEEELNRLTKQLEDIIGFVDKLAELNTDGIEPTSSVIPVVNVTREDAVKPSFDREQALSNAPEKEMGHYKIPKIME